MKKTDPTNDNLTSRVIRGLKAEYRIVSLPYWAWFWLDDFMQQNRISYQGILETFRCDGDINYTLRSIAEIHQYHCMRGIYKLANDNSFLENQDNGYDVINQNTQTPKTYNLPKVYKLFGFIACATTLDSVWTRKNYDEHNQIN